VGGHAWVGTGVGIVGARGRASSPPPAVGRGGVGGGVGGGAVQKNGRVRWRGEWSEGGGRLGYDPKFKQRVPQERGFILHFVTGVA